MKATGSGVEDAAQTLPDRKLSNHVCVCVYVRVHIIYLTTEQSVERWARYPRVVSSNLTGSVNFSLRYYIGVSFCDNICFPVFVVPC